MDSPEGDSPVLAATQHWLTRAVIGLNLCPFAKSVHVRQQIRYVITRATSDQDLLDALESELLFLDAADPLVVDTTVLIVPDMLKEFFDFNDFLNRANRMLKRTRLVGIVQIASFHPLYQFADKGPDDIENYTNRSPYPILHLLREESLDRVLATFPDADSIYERNQETMRHLGLEGWRKWMRTPVQD